MQASINRCLSQARKNWEGCGRKGIRCKNEGDFGGGGAVSSDGVVPTRTVGFSASIIFPCSSKIQKFFMMACNNIFGFNHVGAPTCLRKNRRWGNPARMQQNPMLRQKAVYMMTLPGLINCGRAGPLGLVPGILTH